jgi:hypothetical protein
MYIYACPCVGPVEDVESLARILGCRVSFLPMKYLALPVLASLKAKSICDGIIENIGHWLASWKRLYLSKGGQITLIKCSLSNWPTYYLSIFLISVRVAN